MIVDPVVAVGSVIAVGGFVYSLAEAYFRPWREGAQTGESTKLVIEPLDGGEGAEVVEYETPLTSDSVKKLLEAIRRVESAQEARAEKAAHAG